MSPKERIEPPYPIMQVLDEALGCMDRRFKQVPNGRIEIAWRQPTKRDGEARPERYYFGIEFRFDPEATP